MIYTRVTSRLALSSAIAALCSAVPSHAQDDPQSVAAQNQLQDIVVTANKRSESINKVGLSITAASAETLRAAGVNSVADLAKVVPGFYYTQSLYGTPVFTLRGIGFNTTALGVPPAVSVYVDEVPLPYPAMTPGASLDVQRVEAIKGPQGVLFGANSTGGAINYIAASPTPDLELGSTLTYGSYGRFDGEAYVSGPISSTLSARVAVRAEQGGAWQVSQTRPRDKRGDADRLFGRLLLDFAPNDRLTVRLNINGWRDKSETQARRAVQIIPLIPGTIIGLPANAFAPAGLLASFPASASGSRAADWDAGRAFRNDKDFVQASLRAQYEVTDDLKLTAIGAYSDLRPDSDIDTDGTAYNSVSIIQRGSIRSAFGELRMDAHLSSKADLLVGVNYAHDRIRDSLTADVGASIYNFFLGNPAGIDDTRADTNVNSYAVFSKVDYRLTDQLKLIAAGRYTIDRRSGVLCTYDVGGAIAKLQNLFSGTSLQEGECITATNGAPRGPIEQKLNQTNVSWRFGVEWQPTSATLLYATVNRGYKAGGFPNVFAFEAVQLRPVVQERLDAYEIGAKLRLFDRKLQFNAALFRYDYKNKQIQGRIVVGPLGALETLVNVPQSRVNGAEVDVTATPIVGLSLRAAGSYIDSKIAAGMRAYTPFGDFADVSGQHFPDTPTWQVNLDAGYEHPLTNSVTGFVGGALVYTGNRNSAFGDLPIMDVPSYSLIDARIGVRSPTGTWQVSAFVRNLTNKIYFYSTQQTIDVLTRYYGQPRTFGATLQTKF